MLEALSEPCPNLQSPVRFLEKTYPEVMREWVKYESPDDCSDFQVLEQVKQRFEGPWPTERTIAAWRSAASRERSESRRRVWERQFADASRYLVPKVIVSLDRALTRAVDLLTEAQADNDRKTQLGAMQRIKEIGGELLSHLGAPTLDPTPVDPAQIRAQFIAARISAGKSAAEAEADFADLVAAVSGPAQVLGGGDNG